MAIAKIKKVEIIGLRHDRERLLGRLQKLGLVELIKIEDHAEGSAKRASDIGLLEIEEAIGYLSGYKQKKAFWEALGARRPSVYTHQTKEILTRFDYQRFLIQLSELKGHLRHLSQHKEKLLHELHELFPWRNLKIPLNDLCGTQSCGIAIGTLRASDYTQLKKDCEEKRQAFHCELVNQDKANAYLVIFYLKNDLGDFEGILKEYNFAFVTLPSHNSTVDGRILQIKKETAALDALISDTQAKITYLSKEQFKLMVVYDYLSNIEILQAENKKISERQYTFLLSGWIKENDVRSLEKSLRLQFKDIGIFISEPKRDEALPVDLQNPKLIRPFEFITKIYGLPQYRELDPTPFLAPFFFLYFGLCVSDAGYGLLIMLICLFMLKKFKMGQQGIKFFRLFFLCGISTVIIGAITGSWFGNLVDLICSLSEKFIVIKKAKDSIVLLDPIKEPTKLLAIALSFGIVQVWFGNIVAAIGNIKNRRFLDVIFDQVPMFIFLFGLTGLGLIFLRLITTQNALLFKYSALAAALILLATQGRSEKGLGSKVFYGAFTLYNTLSGYLSDILSYSRLWALGLVTGVMANTINLISIQFAQIITSLLPFMDKIRPIKIVFTAALLLALFVFGHLVSFFMNLLGAFVHPVRLQFVEFFSKFFKAGGRAFKPFKEETKYIKFE